MGRRPHHRTGPRLTVAIEPGARAQCFGFTMLEVVMVIALLAMLAGILAPRGKDLEAARIARATTDVQSLAQALLTFESTVGTWPTMDASGRVDRLRVLLSGARMPTTNPWTAGHQFWSWAAGSTGDLLQNHLVTNTPRGQAAQRYATTGSTAWSGSYVAHCSLDPWDRPYVANVLVGYSTGVNDCRMFVLSAGPDGRIQTAATARATATVAGGAA